MSVVVLANPLAVEPTRETTVWPTLRAVRAACPPASETNFDRISCILLMSARRLDTSSVRRSGTTLTLLSLLPADATEEPERSLLGVSELIVPPFLASIFGSGFADLRDFDARASDADRRPPWVRRRRDFGRVGRLSGLAS